MSCEPVTARDRLVAMVAVLNGGSWETGESFVAQFEREPDKVAQCPCCTKQVAFCKEHYQLHEPGKKCVICRKGAP